MLSVRHLINYLAITKPYTTMFKTNHRLTQRVLCKDVVQDSVRGEFELVRATHVSVQHFQLGLALIELFVVTLFHGDSSMSLVHFYCKLISNTLYLLRCRRRILSNLVGQILCVYAERTVKSCLIDLS